MANKKESDLFSRVVFHDVKIKEIMKAPVITVYEDDDLSVVGEKFILHGISYLPVVSHANQLVGIVSQKYLYKTQSPRRIIGHEEIDYNPQVIVDGDAYYNKESLDSYILRNIMKHDPLTLTPEHTLADAVIAMDKRNISCIPVIDAKRKVVGILTFRELLGYLAKIIK